MLAPLNRFVSALIANILLGDSSSRRGRTYIFLPNIEQIGPVEPLQILLADGPAAGVTLYLGMRDLRALHKQYGREAMEILELCGNLAFFRITHQATASWASGKIGNQLVMVLKNEREARIRRPAVAPSEFRKLPLADSTYALTGYLKNQSMPFYKATLLHDSRLCPPADINFPSFIPRPDYHSQIPDDWNSLLAGIGLRSGSTVPELHPQRQPTRPVSQQVSPAHPVASPPSCGPTQRPLLGPSLPTVSNPLPQQSQDVKPFDLADFPRVDFGE